MMVSGSWCDAWGGAVQDQEVELDDPWESLPTQDSMIP